MEKNHKSILESLLFISNDPVPIEKLSSIIQVPPRKTRQFIDELMAEYEFRGSGIQIIKIENCYQMTTLRDNSEYIELLAQKSQNRGISQPALEILAIIAYKQPITRAEIDSIRGVKSDKAIMTLIEKDLVEEKGQSERPGKPILYGTTPNFLKAFGYSTLKDLPDLDELLNRIEEKVEYKIDESVDGDE